jgi:RimK family alpha-L-glutamate ligase
MNISLLTTLPSLIENKRISEEAKALGHKLGLISLKDFKFHIKDSKFTVDELENCRADVLIVRGIFNSIRSISEILKNMRKKGVKIFDNNFISHQYSINKTVDLVKLSLNKINVPDTAHVRNFLDYPKVAKKIRYPVIVKSTRMGKGVGVHKVESEAELKQFIQKAQREDKHAKNFLIQQFVPYVFDLRCLVVGKHVFTMQRIPAKGEFRANFSLGGDVKTFDLDDEGKKLALSALSAIEMSVGGVDILITEDNKRYVLEVNHTAGFTGMEKATGENIGKLFVKHAIAQAR